MRMLSLLITLLIVGWLVMTQLGGDKPATPDVQVTTGSQTIQAPRNSAEVEQLGERLDALSTGSAQRNLDYVDQASQ